MKLHQAVLEKIVDLPSKDPRELRLLLDDLGLEVKDIQGEGAKTVYNIETLANRGDHLHALGVAREISARYLTPIHNPLVSAELPHKKSSVPVSIVTERCLRYALLEMTVPLHMSLRPDVAEVLHSGGTEVSSERHAIVHLLNYLLLEIGQPMHAFDRDKIDGEILIELSSAEQEVQALDGNTYKVPPQSLLIKDRKKIVAVAGVIGCANSMVGAGTTRVLIESACFDPVSVRKTARSMGLSTDASYTFERGSDFEMAVWALKRLMHLAEGPGGVVKQVEGAHTIGYTLVEGTPHERRKVALHLSTVRKQLNLPRLSEVEITSRLKHLGFGIDGASTPNQYTVEVPTWRLWDVHNEDDLIEDVVRSLGFSRVKLELPPLEYETPEVTPLEALMASIEPVLLGHGFFEVMTKSFYAGDEVELLSRLDPNGVGAHVRIKNAVERNYSHLKITNVLHLSRLADLNHRKGLASVKFYELGRVFCLAHEQAGAKGEYEHERDVLTLAASGRWFEHEWRKPELLEESLLLFKGTLESISTAIGQQLQVLESRHPYLHPGFQGTLKLGKQVCGAFGIVHPLLRDVLELRHEVLYAELEVSKLLKLSRDGDRAPLSDLPSIRRDVTLRVETRTLAGKILRCIDESKPVHLTELAIIDDFKKSDEDFRRLTVRMTFQSAERTLEHGEVDTVVQQVLQYLRDKHHVELA